MQNHNRKKQGLVISYFGNSVDVLVDDEPHKVVHCHLRRNQPLPVVGDHVSFDYEQSNTENTGVIIAIMPRHSLLERYQGRPVKMKPIAANIDFIMIVMAPPPIFAETLIDRYLIAAELLNIPAALVLNKIDLLDNAQLFAAANVRLTPYRDLNYPVILSSIYQAEGLQSLREFLKDKRAVLVGPSGVGKSSIIACLSGLSTIQIAEVSAKGIGKHTTTATRLYQLEGGGSVIDSPGVREFNLWPITREELKRGFREIHHFVGRCKFRDCQHIAEPECGVLKAALDGKISRDRLANYHALWKKAKQHHHDHD